MTNTPPTPAGDEEVEPVVAVARTVGGLALMVIGLVLLIGGAFVYFVPPFIAPFAGGIWETLWNLDFVAAIVGGIGLVIVFLAGAIIRRARKRDLGIQIGVGAMDDAASNINSIVDSGAPAEKRTGTAPPTIV